MAKVFILGAGTPTPTPHRWGSAFAVEVGGETLMVDCGPAATFKLVKMGIFPTRVDYLFFTHHHFDHDVDYPCFLLCRWDQSVGKENQLRVFGPTLTETITERLLGENGAFVHDWKARVAFSGSQRIHVNRGGTLPRKPPSVLAKDVGPGSIYTSREWTVTAAPAVHVQPFLDSLAYRLDSDRGSIVFTGDTQPCDTVRELARGADMMFCMCWDDQERMEAMGETVGQCGTTAAAKMAQEAGVKRLVLVHIGPHLAQHGPMEKGIGDVRRVYDGEVVFADELMTIQL
jgi:ribonuclease BN (tRNA processing enzyme)